MPNPDRLEKDAAIRELERLLASETFRANPRCQFLLKYLVTNALEGRTELLKERAIKTEAFGLPPSYSDRGDPVVRNRVGEVRVALRKYYETEGAASPVRIELPPDSYTPEVRVLSGGSMWDRLRGWFGR
jgi:hypothetical protein